ncbi:hypothetical protein PIB30_078576 [Stylosanthes scabra]|uniref:Uncharacterized protein n=1 Tax=Stylosanthes scabra TaxID=79078 RepID=A0ABU6WP67_9FABA|nr:hypothetical protein [Stylosanthes scabra]
MLNPHHTNKITLVSHTRKETLISHTTTNHHRPPSSTTLCSTDPDLLPPPSTKETLISHSHSNTNHYHPHRQSASLLRSLVTAPRHISSPSQQRRCSVVPAKALVAVFKLAAISAVLTGSFLFAFPPLSSSPWSTSSEGWFSLHLRLSLDYSIVRFWEDFMVSDFKIFEVRVSYFRIFLLLLFRLHDC